MPKPTKKSPGRKRAALTHEPKPEPRVLVRGHGDRSNSRELNLLRSQIPTGWRLVVSGNGGNMSQSWTATFQLGVTPDRRAWVLSMADWGDMDRPRRTPKVSAIAAVVDPSTNDESEIVQKLVDVSADWFNIDEVTEEGDFEVKLPGFD